VPLIRLFSVLTSLFSPPSFEGLGLFTRRHFSPSPAARDPSEGHACSSPPFLSSIFPECHEQFLSGKFKHSFNGRAFRCSIRSYRRNFYAFLYKAGRFLIALMTFLPEPLLTALFFPIRFPKPQGEGRFLPCIEMGGSFFTY